MMNKLALSLQFCVQVIEMHCQVNKKSKIPNQLSSLNSGMILPFISINVAISSLRFFLCSTIAPHSNKSDLHILPQHPPEIVETGDDLMLEI